MARLSEQVRLRLREEMDKQKVSQRDLAGLLGWSQSRVAHLLTGRVEMSIDDLAEMAFGLSMSVVEAIRDRGLEFMAEMTPTELGALNALRALPQADRDAIIQILGMKLREHEQRHAHKKIVKKGRLS
jgi:transcriptional regulator with XRE-family HTH domain